MDSSTWSWWCRSVVGAVPHCHTNNHFPQSVFECFPPSKHKLEMERICALLVSPFLGYRGLYLNNDNQYPVIKSNEPELARSLRTKPSLGLSTESDRLAIPPTRLLSMGQRRTPVRKVSLQPVFEKSGHNSLNYLMARVNK